MKSKINKVFALLFSVILSLSCIICFPPVSAEKGNPKTDWMAGKYGIDIYLMQEFLSNGCTMDTWNEIVNGLDVNKIANLCEEVGASWVQVPIYQTSGIAPIPINYLNAITNKTFGAQRDFFADLYTALSAKNIKMMVYFIPGAPTKNGIVAKAMGAGAQQNNGRDYVMNYTMAQHAAGIMSELSERYGNKIAAFWIDGSYDNIGFNERIAELEGNALKSNGDSTLVAFNNGTKARDVRYEIEDFTCGETTDKEYMSRGFDGRWSKGGAQNFISTYLASNWGQKGTVYNTDDFLAHTYNDILSKGAAVMFNIYYNKDNEVDDAQVEQLKALKAYVASKPAYTPVSYEKPKTDKPDSTTDNVTSNNSNVNNTNTDLPTNDSIDNNSGNLVSSTDMGNSAVITTPDPIIRTKTVKKTITSGNNFNIPLIVVIVCLAVLVIVEIVLILFKRIKGRKQ